MSPANNTALKIVYWRGVIVISPNSIIRKSTTNIFEDSTPNGSNFRSFFGKSAGLTCLFFQNHQPHQLPAFPLVVQLQEYCLQPVLLKRYLPPLQPKMYLIAFQLSPDSLSSHAVCAI